MASHSKSWWPGSQTVRWATSWHHCKLLQSQNTTHLTPEPKTPNPGILKSLREQTFSYWNSKIRYLSFMTSMILVQKVYQVVLNIFIGPNFLHLQFSRNLEVTTMTLYSERGFMYFLKRKGNYLSRSHFLKGKNKFCGENKRQELKDLVGFYNEFEPGVPLVIWGEFRKHTGLTRLALIFLV